MADQNQEPSAATGGQSALTEILDADKHKKAIEFAEYMAKSAEHYMTTVDDCWGCGDLLTEAHLDELRDAHRLLCSSIYEFRKRAPNAGL